MTDAPVPRAAIEVADVPGRYRFEAAVPDVPGPAQPASFCGAVLRQNMFWVPASGDVGLGVSILSYAGGVQFGLIADHRLCPDPQAIIDRFGAEFDQLLLLAMMLPWAGEALG